jgi:D-sedoheptulose 7-phosphate isomerase
VGSAVSAGALAQAARAAFERRRAAVERIADNATNVALACRDMAERFQAGGRLLVFGSGGGATDAEHIAVEFVHPVIVGKRALPALSLASDSAALTGISDERGASEIFSHQILALGRPGDIALGLSDDGDGRGVLRGLEAAREKGMLTVALVGGDGGQIARDAVSDHCFVTPSADSHVVKESDVTTYHVLWELVHVFFDTPRGEVTEPESSGGVESLYPFLYGGLHPADEVLDSVAASTIDKVAEIVRLRAEAGKVLAEPLAACALQMAAGFEAGATLWTFGNGGSSTDAQEIVHSYLDPPNGYRTLPALCLTSDAAIVTALSNDVGYDVVFARQLRAFGRAGDIAMGLSTSGGSANVLGAFDDAKAMGLMTVGIAGYGGGRMAESSSVDHLFAVSSASVHRVQEVQTTIYHVLWELIQLALGEEPQESAQAYG